MSVTTSIVNSRVSVDEDNNSEIQKITFNVTRVVTTWWDDNKPLVFTLKYRKNDDTQQVLTQTLQFNFPKSVSSKNASVNFVVPHKDDGTQKIDFSAKINTGTSVGTLNPTKLNVNLTPIDLGLLRIYINNHL